MRSMRWERYAPLTGLLFVALVIPAFILGGEPPDTDDEIGKVVDFWKSNDTDLVISSILGALACLPFLWFVGSLRSALRLAEGGTGRLSAIAFAGGIVFAAGLLVGVSIQFAAAESADSVPPQVTQTLSVLNSDFFFPFPVGGGTLALATALVVLRHAALPSWLGWTALLIGIASFTPAGFFAFLALGVWIAITSVVLYQRGAAVPPAAPPPLTAP